MNKYLGQLAKESIVYGLAGLATRFAQLTLVPLYTHIFAPAQYGLLGIVSSSIALIQIFSVLALDSASYRYFYETEDITDRKATIGSWFWCQFGLTGLLVLIVYSFSEAISIFLTGNREAGLLLKLGGVNLLPLAITNVAMAWFRFQRRAVATGIISLVINFLTIVLSVLFILIFKYGLPGIFLAQLISNSLGAILAIIYMRSWLHPFYFRISRLHNMLIYSSPLIPASIATWIVTYSSRFYIQYFQTSGDVGLYQLGANLALVVALFTNAFQQAWGPFSMSIYKQKEARHVYAASLNWYLLLTCFIGTAVTVFAPELVELLATNDYSKSSSIVGLLVFGYIATGSGYIANIGPSIVKSLKPLGVSIILASLFQLLLSFLLVPSFGNIGAATASLISQVFIAVYVFIYSQKMYPIPYQFGVALTILLGSLALIFLFSFLHIEPDLLRIGLKTITISFVFLLLPLLVKMVSISQIQSGWIWFRNSISIKLQKPPLP